MGRPLSGYIKLTFTPTYYLYGYNYTARYDWAGNIIWDSNVSGQNFNYAHDSAGRFDLGDDD